MIDRDDTSAGREEGGEDPLPDELVELHRELDSLRIQERASFGPELRAELEVAWAEERAGPRDRKRSRAPALLAASFGGILLLGLSAPQARAALADIVGNVRQSLVELVQPEEAVESAAPRPRTAEVEVGAPTSMAPAAESGEARTEAAVDEAGADTGAGPSVAVVFPDLVDRADASRLVQEFYPDQLRGTGVGGTVGLRMYVDASGSVGEVRLTRSSGFPVLDSAAVRAAPSLTFRPARNGATTVGTWVELGIDFAPTADGAPRIRGSGPR